jgi:serine/threonine protein kinase
MKAGAMISGIFYETNASDLPAKINFRTGDILHLRSGMYQVIKNIGQGGFGSVYRIRRDKQDDYALKVLDLWRLKPNEFDNITKRFRAGFKAGTFHSDYLVKNYFEGQISGNPYSIMEFCPNGSLSNRMQEFYQIRYFIPLVQHILQALHDLHQNGIIHRDIKPDNILFDRNDKPKLSDFDIAGDTNQRLTALNWRGAVKEIWGTAVYAPPEQLNHKQAYTLTKPAMDMFAFGISAYEVLSGGHYPYGNFEDFEKNPVDFYEKVKKGRYVPLPAWRNDIPPLICNLVHGCIEADPEKRIASAAQALDILRSFRPVVDPGSPILSHPQKNEWILRVVRGEETGKEYNMSTLMKNGNTHMLRIGWDMYGRSGNAIAIKETMSSFISQHHATLEYGGGHWFLRDGQWQQGAGWVKSLNGAICNGQQVDSGSGIELKHNDMIQLGETILQVIHV